MYFQREEEPSLYKMLDWKEALVLIGPRRAGKTTLAMRMLDLWRERGGQGNYIDLEAVNAPRSIEQFLEKLSETPKGGLIVLDEVQALDGWIKVVRQEIENNYHHLLITGSSASLLSKEIASSLGGRAIPETILPVSYRDAKRWGINGIRQYLDIGGYPECVLRPSDASKLHKLYLELTVLRDVAARKGIRESKPLLDLSVLLLSEIGKTISSKKTSQMLGISQPTFRSFVDALNDAFLVLSVPPFLRSPREKLVSDAKHYAYDLGIQKSVTLSTETDLGRRVENLVAIELVRRGYSVSYMKLEDGECDFIAQKFGSKPLAIQVWSGSGEIPKRETESLNKAIKFANADGYVLSLNESDVVFDNINILSLEKWLLSI